MKYVPFFPALFPITKKLGFKQMVLNVKDVHNIMIDAFYNYKYKEEQLQLLYVLNSCLDTYYKECLFNWIEIICGKS